MSALFIRYLKQNRHKVVKTIYYTFVKNEDKMIKKAKKLLKNAESILIFAGAGMSADSGLATYRDKDGFWNDYPPYKLLNKDYMDFTNPQGFRTEPEFAWGFYGHLYNLYKNAKPHTGYKQLKKFLEINKKNYFVLSSNVDGLFLKAGYNQKSVHEVHGVVRKFQCTIPCTRTVWEPENCSFDIDEKTMTVQNILPTCPKCNSIARPNIFMFNDNDNSYVWEEALKGGKRFQNWINKYSKTNVVILLLGIGQDGLKSHAKKYADLCDNAKIISISLEIGEFEKNNDFMIIQGRAKSVLEKLLS